MQLQPDNLKINSQHYLCNYPLSMDLYGGCTHGCAYCFAKVHKNMSNSTKRMYEITRPASYERFIKMVNDDCPDYKKGGTNWLLKHFIDKRQPVHIGGMADPFPYGVEENLHHTRGFLERVGDYPCIWSTKNPMTEYIDLMSQGKHILQVSLIGFGSKFRVIEPGAPTPEERLEAAQAYREAGIKVICRMQPFIPHLYNASEIERFMERIAKSFDAVTVEFYKHGVFAENDKMSKAIGLDLDAYMKKHGVRNSFNYYYKNSVKEGYIKVARDAAHANGLQFYCADDSFRDLGEYPTCCGICPADKGFESKMRLNSSQLVFELKEKGVIKVKDFFEKQDEIYKIASYEALNTNAGDRRGMYEQRTKSILEEVERAFTTKCDDNPAVYMKNIGLKKINGELCFVYKG